MIAIGVFQILVIGRAMVVPMREVDLYQVYPG